MEKIIFKVGELIKCVNISILKGNDVAPPLELSMVYNINGIALDKDGNQHLDVGLVSKYSYVTSHETSEKLPDGDKIHWCHPSRFEHIVVEFQKH